ncbi:MAG: binding-protein-dependent transport system inner rane component [Xanthomonadaceae bacterium]|nr:binding-protein-dependent transport system inner rane component [Xanthomonadaceae bacterium]
MDVAHYGRMAEALHALSSQVAPARRGAGILAIAPVLTVLVFGLPIGAGLLGTLLPAFGYLPALGGLEFGSAPWKALIDAPGFATALQLTLVTGWLAALLSLGLAVAIVAFVYHRRWARRLGEAMAPMLAMPHSALAIGLAFLIAPSGWLTRWVSPGLTGWDVPPDVSTVGHPSGGPLILSLLLKEVPYLVLMLLAAMNQVRAREHVAIARSLGYGPVQSWFDVVLPQLYRQIRLPVYAVLAFSLSVVDVSLILGPGNPPTLAVLAVRWFADPDLHWLFAASAAATVLLGIVAASILLWHGGERVIGRVLRARIARGVRSRSSAALAGAASAFGAVLLLTAMLAMIGITLWSFAAQWRYPDALPSTWTFANWQRQSIALALPALTTLVVAAASTIIALVLVLACLENETRDQRRRTSKSLWLLYMPLLVPQVAFLFGVQVLLVRIGADGRLLAVIAIHLVFVLPYLFLSLADPWRSFDERYARTASSLGASRWRVFWRIKLPILLKPVLMASAVAFAVSVGQYLPTLFAGAGRVATLTTEAVTLSAGADRRVIGAWAVLQAVFPLVVFVAAAWVPRFVYRHRRALT